MHKIALTAVLSLVTVSSALAGGGLHTVTDTPTVVLPTAGQVGAPAWTPSNPYVAGETVRLNGNFYLVIVAGTSGAVGPTGRGDSVDGTATWRAGLNRARSGLYIRNDGTGDVTVPLDGGQGPKLGAGVTLVWSDADSVPQGVIKLVSESGASNSVYISEW